MIALTPTPIANRLPEKPDGGARRYPLEVCQCPECGHVQLRHYLGDRDHYGPMYTYRTPDALMPVLREHAAALRVRYPNARSVIEIGCNNGLNLLALMEQAFEPFGVDPSSSEIDGRIRAKPFERQYCSDLEKVDLIVANNVLAHVESLWEVFFTIDMLLKTEGHLVFEVQYLPDMVRSGTFDMIYHEHHDYHTLSPLPKFLRHFGLVVTDIERLSAHGGSIRVHCSRPGKPVRSLVQLYEDDSEIDWLTFGAKIERNRWTLNRILEALPEKVVAFGATAKSCTLIHHYGIEKYIECVMDETPEKIGKYIPGTGIPILHPKAVKQPKFILLTAWNYAGMIAARYPKSQLIDPFPMRRAA